MTKLLQQLWVALVWVLPFCASAADHPLIVFVTGDHEYRSERTMPWLAGQLEEHFSMRTIVLHATTPEGRRDETFEKNIPGLEALKRADLAVFFLRWRQLPQEQLDLIQAYLDSGKPLIGFRTTSHAFKYPEGDPRVRWNAFGEFAFGTPPGWGGLAGHTHYGHRSSTDVSVNAQAAGHPIVQGVAPKWHVRSWLYHVVPQYPPAGATVLLTGVAVDPDHAAVPNPVAWSWQTKEGARTFYTSLGHPEDFRVESFQRLVVNAIYWGLNRPGPKAWPGKLPIDIPYEKPKS